MTSQRPRPSFHDQRGKALVWVLAILLIAGAAFAIYWFALRGGGGGGASSQLASSVVPPSADTVAGIDAGALLASPELADMLAKQGVDVAAVKAKLAEAGMKPEDLKSLVVASQNPDAGAPEVMLAMETTADVKSAQGALKALEGMLPGEVGRNLDISNVQAFAGGVILAGAGPLYDAAAKLATAHAGGGGMGPQLVEVRDAVDAGAPIWVASTLPKEGLGRALGGMGKQLLGDGKPTHVALSVRFGSKIEIKLALRIEGAAASKIADNIDGMLSAAGMFAKGEQADMLSAVKIGSSGSSVTLAVALSPDQLKGIAGSRLPF